MTFNHYYFLRNLPWSVARKPEVPPPTHTQSSKLTPCHFDIRTQLTKMLRHFLQENKTTEVNASYQR